MANHQEQLTFVNGTNYSSPVPEESALTRGKGRHPGGSLNDHE